MAQSKIKTLTCSCCGALTQGRQWHNRDTGYGVCERCATSIGEKQTPVEMLSNYGEKGFHYALKEWSVWVGGMEVNSFKLDKLAADEIANRYKQEGYDDVAVQRS
jgi:NAD-dependent SIR2 family protein deacetylase